MNNFEGVVKPRKRRKNMLIVEGEHEKNNLLGILLKVYPEIDIEIGDIIVYGTTIYQLYNEILKEYKEYWYDEDVNLPLIISRKLDIEESLDKNDFTNIILMFDYDRHAPAFSEAKISQLQQYFQDAADVGKLYINYPMVESYQHLFSIPDDDYAERSISRTLKPGHIYKKIVKKSIIAELIGLPTKLKKGLSKDFGIEDLEKCAEYVEKILQISSVKAGLLQQVRNILVDALEENKLQEAQNYIEKLMIKCNYASCEKNYYEYMRYIFDQIVIHNIRKANGIQRQKYHVPDIELKKCFETLNFNKILEIQNSNSKDNLNGKIWVISTGVFFIPDYNFSLISL